MNVDIIASENISLLLTVGVISFALSLLRATFKSEGSDLTSLIVAALRYVSAGVAFSLFYTLLLLVDANTGEGPVIPFHPVVNMLIILLLSLWGLDLLYWLSSFGKNIRDNGPVEALKEINPFNNGVKE